MAEIRITGMTAAGALSGTELVEVSQLSATVIKTATTLSALAADNAYLDSASGFIAAGFAVGNRVKVVGFTGNAANNIFVGAITALLADKMTIGGTDGDVIVDDAAGETVTIAKWETHRTTPQAIADLANTYVDSKVAGLSWKQAVRAATTANGTLASAFENGDTIDGVVLATGNRILLKNQTTGSENGIYTVNASGAPTRATDADSGAELVNASVYVSEGTTLADTQWVCTTNATITVGSTSLVFVQLTSGGGALQASNNLSDLANAAAARTNLGLIQTVAFQILTTSPAASEVLCLYPVNRAFTLRAGLAGTIASITTNPTATFDIDVQRQVNNAGAFSSIGTISVSTGGVVTLTTTSGTSKAIAVNDVLKFVGDATGDTTFLGAFNVIGDL